MIRCWLALIVISGRTFFGVGVSTDGNPYDPSGNAYGAAGIPAAAPGMPPGALAVPPGAPAVPDILKENPQVAVSETLRQSEKRTAMSNGLQDLRNLEKNDPLKRLGLNAQRLRTTILRKPEEFEKISGIVIINLPKQDFEKQLEHKQKQRGVEQLLTGNPSGGCVGKAQLSENSVLEKVSELSNPKNVEEMLRAMTLQERIAFDEQQLQSMQAEEGVLLGQLDTLLQRQKEREQAYRNKEQAPEETEEETESKKRFGRKKKKAAQ